METVNSRTAFEGLKVGQWIDTSEGVYEVTALYNAHYNAVCMAEILFNRDGDPCTMCEASWRTYSDVRGAEVL